MCSAAIITIVAFFLLATGAALAHVVDATTLTQAEATPSTAWAIANAGPDPVGCASPNEGYYTLVYAYTIDGMNRSSMLAPQIQRTAYETRAFIDAESRRIAPLERKRLRLQCYSSGGDATVHTVRLSTTTSNTTTASIKADLRSQGILPAESSTATVRAIVHLDAPPIFPFGGQGDWHSNDIASDTNPNNYGGLVAVQYSDAPSWKIVTHEVMHTMGAVQNSAPHSDKNAHCTQGLDVMCTGKQLLTCQNLVLDCKNDDYFTPTSTTSSYLATHWNVGSRRNRFLKHTTDAAAVPISPTFSGYGTIGTKYWFVDAVGNVTGVNGAQLFGNLLGVSLASPIADIEPTGLGLGYVITLRNGTIYTFGNAQNLVGLPQMGIKTSSNITHIRVDDNGYTLDRTDGGSYELCGPGGIGSGGAGGGPVGDATVVDPCPTQTVTLHSNADKWRINATTTAVASVVKTDKNGFYRVSASGLVGAYGTAVSRGSLTQFKDFKPKSPITGISLYGDGYKLIAADRSYTFTSTVKPTNLLPPPAMPGKLPNGVSAVDATRTSTGNGYWATTTKGAVYAYGDAVARGGTSGKTLNKPISAIVATANNAGYWLIAQDGGVFSFNATFWGSLPCLHIVPNYPILDAQRWGSGGYVLISPQDGGLFHFDATHTC